MLTLPHDQTPLSYIRWTDQLIYTHRRRNIYDSPNLYVEMQYETVNSYVKNKKIITHTDISERRISFLI
jgi:hypothetical protein